MSSVRLTPENSRKHKKNVLAPGPELAGEKSMHGTDCIMALFLNNLCKPWLF
jgi:hypothetical protein